MHSDQALTVVERLVVNMSRRCTIYLVLVFLLTAFRGSNAQDFLLADVNSDGNVDFADFNILANHFGTFGTFEDGDLLGDGTVGFPDFLLLSVLYGEGASERPIGNEPDDRVALIADTIGGLHLYAFDAVRVNGYSILSANGGLRTAQMPSEELFDFYLSNDADEIAQGDLFGGRRLTGALLVATYSRDPDDAVDDLTFLFGTKTETFQGPVLPSIPGDADLDGEVQFSDFLLLANSFGLPGDWSQGDFDMNGQVEFADYLVLASRFGESVSLRANAVPEPAGLVLLLTAFLVLREN